MRAERRSIAVGALMVAGLGAFSVSEGSAKYAPGTSVASTVSDAGAAADETCRWCYNGEPWCPAGFHQDSWLWVNGADRVQGGNGHGNCTMSTCFETAAGHTAYATGEEPCEGECVPGGDAAPTDEMIATSLLRNDLAALGRAIHADPSRLVLNIERAAVQRLDGRGGVISHFPLSPGQLVAVGTF